MMSKRTPGNPATAKPSRFVGVWILGGLGNQMFQYAAGRALALRLGAELKLDLSWFSTIAEGDTPRRYMLGDAFSIAAATATPEECARLRWREESGFSRFLRAVRRRPRPYATTCICEPYFSYWADFERLTPPAYLLGYWQNELYFKAIADMIRQDFMFPPLRDEAETLAQRIRAARNPVAVHVRRGDYVSNPVTHRYHGVCSPEYYSEALAIIAAKAGSLELFLFSDDPAWVREHFGSEGFSVNVVEFSAHVNLPWHDMHLMSLCKHHITANSSFSWWGAWLANGGGMVCAPRRWFAEESKVADNPAPDKWILL